MSCAHTELAPLYALESLNRHDARVFEEHLHSCTYCKTELQSFVETASCLTFSVSIKTPSKTVHTELLNRIKNSFDKVLIRCGAGVWKEVSVGVDARWLFRPTGFEVATLMLRMEADSRVSLRTFNDPVQVYMLHGRASVANCVINSGDFLAISDAQSHIKALSNTEMFLVGHKQMLDAHTTTHDGLHDYCYDLLPHYAIDDLSMRDWRIVSEHLLGCRVCQEHLSGLYKVTEVLALSVEPLEPPAGVKAKLMALVGGQAQRTGRVVKAEEGKWESMLDGVYFKKLLLDERSGLATALYRLEPGAIIPTHPHANIEECLVLEGSFRSSQEVYSAGDYMCMPPKTMHESFIAPNGAVMLIVERRAA